MATEFIMLALLPLRLALGIICIIRGTPKLSIEKTSTIFLKLGIPAVKLSAILAAIIEVFGGVALIIGFATRIVAALLVIETAVLAYKKKVKKKKGYEFDLVLIAAFIILFFLGSGSVSIDQMFGWLLG